MNRAPIYHSIPLWMDGTMTATFLLNTLLSIISICVEMFTYSNHLITRENCEASNRAATRPSTVTQTFLMIKIPFQVRHKDSKWSSFPAIQRIQPATLTLLSNIDATMSWRGQWEECDVFSSVSLHEVLRSLGVAYSPPIVRYKSRVSAVPWTSSQLPLARQQKFIVDNLIHLEQHGYPS